MQDDPGPQVFINCPFDKSYRRLFHATVFTVLRCGFAPRTAWEQIGSGKARFDRLIQMIRECPLAVHDLSRVELGKMSGMPRFNMPLELGFFIGAREFGDEPQRQKDFLVFERNHGDSKQACTDLGGVDPVAHHNKETQVIRHVRQWLNTHSTHSLPGEQAILNDYQRFKLDLPQMLLGLSVQLVEMTYHDFRRAAKDWIVAENDGWL